MEYICKHCNGKGETEEYTELRDVNNHEIWQKTKLCIKCLGKGKLDWIENATGVDYSKAGDIILKHPSTHFKIGG